MIHANSVIYLLTSLSTFRTVMMMKPKEAVYFKTNIKSPGFSSKPIQTELEVDYDTHIHTRDGSTSSTRDPYARLVLDVCRGRQGHFVRNDEVARSWELLDPVLAKLEGEGTKPLPYKKGSRGPENADKWINEKSGYKRNQDYVYFDGSVARKSESESKMVFDYNKNCYVPADKAISADDLCDVGLYGLAVMGQNFSLNMASKGFSVCVGNRSPGKVGVTVLRARGEGSLPLYGSGSPENFIRKLKRPRKVIILVQAGKPVDDTIAQLSKFMDPGDVIIDGGNEWYPNSIRRGKMLHQKGIHFIGMGISGGEEGARNGPSLMPGGPKEAYDLVAPIFTACAARTDKGPCVGYLGPIGSGNYVKMVHNGIEYGDMQLIAEVYDILKVTSCRQPR
jgi:3-hydroxyisobutyrate dehydrogenase-like beta-hydroxyacid dehydrogenase